MSVCFKRMVAFASQRGIGLLTVAYIFVGCLVPLMIWRIWTFTIKPFLRPEEPKEFPYWVPCGLLKKA